ncbi:MAG: hypothetical protein DHS20C04_15530 [Hyphococcus sp.]|nr:MAG: hypothetical protein DHS20C04_15530 [Marinicaulis sp.]
MRFCGNLARSVNQMFSARGQTPLPTGAVGVCIWRESYVIGGAPYWDGIKHSFKKTGRRIAGVSDH